MYATNSLMAEPVEVPAAVLWKRTLLLGVVGVSIGLEGGYLLGRSISSPPKLPSHPSAMQARYLPRPEMNDEDEMLATGEERMPTWMPNAWDSPQGEPLPPRRFGPGRPRLIRMEADARPAKGPTSNQSVLD
jgi:hypothetical protein